MTVTITLHLTLKEFVEYTAELYKQGINFTVKRCDFDSEIIEWSITYTGY